MILLSFCFVPESKAETHRGVDWAGVLIVTAGLAGVTYGFIESAALGWGNPAVWGSLTTGFLLVLVFFYVEAYTRFPMVPLGLFRSRDFTGANLLTLFLYAALGIFFFLYPLNLIQVQHYSATVTGAASLPFIFLMSALSRWSGGLVTRFGAKRPLIVGPLISAAGFLLFAVPSVGGAYWTTFFPGFVVLGLGMAVSVAPLTTVVMGAVSQSHAGTASGINNAVARLAGLLAVAIFGMSMVSAFSHYMNHDLMQMNIPLDALRDLQSNVARLAAVAIPRDIDPSTAAQLKTLIDRAFVFGFRIIMLACAALSLASSAFAWRMIAAHSQLDRAA